VSDQFALDFSAGPSDTFLADFADVLVAGFGGLAFFIVESGSCSMMNLLLPPSSALSCVNAEDVVPEQEKRSQTLSPLS
jgi:hypothetical protein